MNLPRVSRAPRRPSGGVLAATAASLATASLALFPQVAGAATTTLTVDTNLHSATAALVEDSNPGDGTCATTGGACTLTAAIQEANALPASPGDDVRIVFADNLTGVPGGETNEIELPDNGHRMQTTGASHVALSNGYLGDGFFYAVDAQRPVTIDFGNDVSVVSAGDANYGIFLAKSANVTIENFANLRGGASSITVDGTARNTTIRNGQCSDPDTVILEACVGIISEAAGVDIVDLKIDSSVYFGIFVDRADTGDAPVSDVAVTRFEGKDNSGHGDIWFEIDAKVQGFTVDDSDFDSPGGFAFGLQSGSEVEGLKITDSRFVAANSTAIYTYANSTTKDLVVEDSTFDGTAFAFYDLAGSTHDGLTFRGNRFVDVLNWVLDFENGTYENAVIEDNEFVDARNGGLTTVWAGQTGVNNVIRGNTFTQAEDAAADRWAIFVSANPGVGASTGWRIERNHVDGYFTVASGPIVNRLNGTTPTTGNTFGPRTRGTLDPDQSEAGLQWFATNYVAGANDRIQTWRPTSAAFTGTELKLSVAPVTPPLGGNTQPTAPVGLDVYWTADEHAEEYLGRIDDVATAGSFTLPTTKTTGKIRLQTQDADGNSSQYSSPVRPAVVGTPPAAPVIVKVEDDGSAQGTGESGATVEVHDQTGKLVGTATVKPDGTWSIPGPVACGSTLTATQKDAAGNVSAVSDPVKTADCPTNAPTTPVITKIDPTGIVATVGSDPGVRCEVTIQRNGQWVVVPSTRVGDACHATPPSDLGPGSYPVRIVVTDAAGRTAEAFTTLVVLAPVQIPASEDDIRLQCGALPLAIVDVKRGARSKSTKRYGRTTIVGVADKKHVGQRVAIRYMASNRVVARPKVQADGRFRATVADPDQKNRKKANSRRFRAEIGSDRSSPLKLTRRLTISSIRAADGSWTVRARASRPLVKGAAVHISVRDACGTGWKRVATGKLSANGSFSGKVPAPAAGGFQLVRVDTTVRASKTSSRKARTFTEARGIN